MKSFLLLFFVCFTVVFVSCNSDKVELSPDPDFSIVSTSTFEVISTYENGWIEKATQKDLEGNVLTEIEYYSNGYIKHARRYSRFPNYLFQEIHRTEDNLPLNSTYYDKAGDAIMTISYNQGVIAEKQIFSSSYTSTFSYENGLLSSVVKSNADSEEVITVTYDYTNGTQSLVLSSGSEVLFSNELEMNDLEGFGIDFTHDMFLSSAITDYTVNKSRQATGYSSSINWENEIKATSFVPATINYHNWFGQESYPEIQVKLISNDEIYRSIAEQYPVIEDEILIGGGRYIDERFTVSVPFSVQDDIEAEMSADEAVFLKKYGNQYCYEYFTGKYQLLIGTIRNLPSDEQLREQLKDLAYKKVLYLTSGDEIYSLNEEEQELLGQVFFELKIHSSFLPEVNGRVIDSYQTYDESISFINNADNQIVQRGFRSY